MTVELTQAGPGLHAVVIGVSKYRHLSGGEPDHLRKQFEKLGQLFSPGPSARHLANWLMNERVDPTSPLRSLQVLISDAPNEAPLVSSQNDSVAVSEPTAANIVNAVRQMKDFADAYAENKIFFYFCGHGLSYNVEDILLAGDFGENTYDYFQSAINVKHLLSGMKTCKAASQLFLFDACRSKGDEFKPVPTSFGVPIINFDGGGEVNAKQVNLWASSPGNPAHGYTDGRPSVFSKAILAAFRGAAARKDRSIYKISSLRIKEAVDEYVLRRSHARQISQLESASLDFSIAQLASAPVVPVTVLVESSGDLPASLHCWSHPKADELAPRFGSDPAELPWHIDVEAGVYDFAAAFFDGTERYTNEEEISPPYVDITL